MALTCCEVLCVTCCAFLLFGGGGSLDDRGHFFRSGFSSHGDHAVSRWHGKGGGSGMVAPGAWRGEGAAS